MSKLHYHRVATDLRDAFIMQNGDGTFNTGKVDANFTKKLSKDGVGNQSTTGVTITEVSAANNPGEYAVLATAAAFPATVGTYVLTMTLTADTKQTFSQIYVVNQTGTPESTPASFTATASDGRITDGVNPIEDATVTWSLGSTFYTQVTSDASGLYGPVYLVDGTYTVRVQATGYAQSSFTVTVSGASVTGPGTDIALTAGSTANPLSAAQLWAYVRRQYSDQTGSKSDAVIKGVVNDALDQVSMAHEWPRLWTRGTLALRAPYTTGTVTITNGSANVVLTGGTWPTWAASGKLLVNNQIIDVDTRASGSTLTMADAWEADTLTDVGYVLYQNEYDLPDEMWRFGKILPGQRWPYGTIATSIQTIVEAENIWTYGQNFPHHFAIANNKLVLWPYPDTAAMVAFSYYRRPARLTSDTDIADWDMTHIEVLRRACDYQLALNIGKLASGNDANTCLAAYRGSLALAVAADREPSLAGDDNAALRVRQPYSWRRS